MTIDDATLYMELYKRKLSDSVSDLDKDIEAYDMAINIMHKYQKIEQIAESLKTLTIDEMSNVEMQIREVLEDGNNNNRVHEEKVRQPRR